MITVSVQIKKDLPIQKLKQWQDKVVYGIARATLDFTSSGQHFPYLTGELSRSSMAQGVVGSNSTYYIGAQGVSYAPAVWKYGEGTNWTNPNTIPQWYMGVFGKYKSEILQNAIKNAESELR